MLIHMSWKPCFCYIFQIVFQIFIFSKIKTSKWPVKYKYCPAIKVKLQKENGNGYFKKNIYGQGWAYQNINDWLDYFNIWINI